MQQSKRTAAARVILHSPKFIFLAKHRPALAETEGRGQTLCLRPNRCAATADGMGWGRRISQIAFAPSPLCPQSLDCCNPFLFYSPCPSAGYHAHIISEVFHQLD